MFLKETAGVLNLGAVISELGDVALIAQGSIIDFDGGGRFQCELTDVDPASVSIGDRVEMTFRRLYTQDGIHDYFWKARPTHG